MKNAVLRLTGISLLVTSSILGVFQPAVASPVPPPVTAGFNLSADSYSAYVYAPGALHDLINWTQGVIVPGHALSPANPVRWDGSTWVNNLLTYGPRFDPRLDWAAAVDHHEGAHPPEVEHHGRS